MRVYGIGGRGEDPRVFARVRRGEVAGLSGGGEDPRDAFRVTVELLSDAPPSTVEDVVELHAERSLTDHAAALRTLLDEKLPDGAHVSDVELTPEAQTFSLHVSAAPGTGAHATEAADTLVRELGPSAGPAVV